MNTCKYFWPNEEYDLQKNALRIELITTAGFCGARRKNNTDHIDAIRWVGSGGCPGTVFCACPLNGDNQRCKIYQDICEERP